MSDGPSKYELVSYLSGIISIMQEIDKSGTQSRPQGALARDYQRAYDRLHEILHEEEAKDKQNAEDA